VAWLGWVLTPVRVVLGGLTRSRCGWSGRRSTAARAVEEELRTLRTWGPARAWWEREEGDDHTVFELEDTLALL